MDFKEFMRNRKLLVCDNFLTDMEAIELLIKETKYDIIKYPYTKKILECNNNGKYYYEYELKRDCDIANGFNVNFTFICGLKEYKMEDLKEIIPASINYIYNPVKLRIIFNEIFKRNEKEQEIFM